MPLYTMFLILGYWPLGAIVCDVWLCIDYTMSNASVANLLIICFDRLVKILLIASSLLIIACVHSVPFTN